MVLVTFLKDKIWLQYFGLSTSLTLALFGIIEIYTLKSKKILDAEIIGFKSNSEYDLEDNVNFDLEIKILLPDNKIQNANIKALYLRKPIL